MGKAHRDVKTGSDEGEAVESVNGSHSGVHDFKLFCHMPEHVAGGSVEVRGDVVVADDGGAAFALLIDQIAKADVVTGRANEVGIAHTGPVSGHSVLANSLTVALGKALPSRTQL